MNSESKTIKPKNDFQLVVNYSNHCVWENLKDDSSAGANASSRVDMELPATDPLSEIVWSPNRGFSLNCVDSSFADKNNSLYQDVRPSNMVFALLQGVAGGISSTDVPIDDVFVNPITVICAKSGISSTDTSSRNPSDQSGAIIPDCAAHKEHDAGCGGNMEKTNAARGASNLPSDQKENLINYYEKNICDQANIGTAITSEIKGNKSSTISGQVKKRPFEGFLPRADEPKPNMERNPSPAKLTNGGMDIGSGNQVVVNGLCTKVEHIIEHESSGALTSCGRSLIEKLESTAENDLQTSNCEAICAATSAAFVSMSNEDRNKSQSNGTMLQPCDKKLPVSHSICNSRINATCSKSKEKSLSDWNENVSLLKDENDNHLGVESCSSAGLFSTGNKRGNFQQWTIGSKRTKRQIQKTSYFKSRVKQDSSFMNLISNMMKGFSQSTQDEGMSLALTVANPDHHLLWHDQKPITCNENQDPEPRGTGFKSNFKSMSCPSLKNVRTVKSHQAGEAFKLSDKVQGIDATPINYCVEKSRLYKWYLQSNASEESTGIFDASSSLQPKIRPVNLLSDHENTMSNSVETKHGRHTGLSKEKERKTFHSSSTRQDRNNNETGDSYEPSVRKVTDKIFHKSDTPEGLWMTRFLPKSTAPLLNFDNLNEIGESQVHSTGFSVLPHPHKHLLNEGKKLQNCCINKEASTGLKDSKGYTTITPFPGLRDSEPMASMFARRLGAIKHIPTDSTPHR